MKHILPIVVLFIFLYSCGTSKKTPVEPSPTFIDNFIAPNLYSYININYKINKKGLTDTFNFIIDDLAKIPMTFPAYNVTTKLKRSGNVGIVIEKKEVRVTMPVDVEVIKKTFLKDFKANGTLELSFITRLDIDKTWTLTTITELAQYKWIKTPKIDLGVLNFPIETISNMILEKSRVDLEQSIDQSIKESYDLKAIIKEVARYTLIPYELDSVFGGWMQMVADSAYFSPAINTASYTEGKISLKTKMNISSTRPRDKEPIIPVFSWKERIKDSSEMKFLMELEYDHLSKIARNNFVGQVFEDGGKKIQILDVKVGKKVGKLEVTTTVKGDFNGDLSVRGIPAFDSGQKLLFAKDIDVSVKTGNVLYNAAAWLLKGKIKSQLDEMLRFPIADEMENVQSQVDGQVEEMNRKYKMKMKVRLGNLSVDNVILRPDRANAYVTLKLKLDTTLDNLAFFRE